MKYVGDALHGSNRPCIGIATWGYISGRESLEPTEEISSGGVFPYYVDSWLCTTGAYLDYNHTHFILVDDGTTAKPGGEIEFRAKLEEYIMAESQGTYIFWAS